jgi:hypothetical protein
MSAATQLALEPSALTAFTASLATLPAQEIRKAKSLYLRNAMADYRMTVKTGRGFLVMFGIMSIIPIFLIIFVPALIAHRAGKENGKQKIRNALEVWKDDLGADYASLAAELETL